MIVTDIMADILDGVIVCVSLVERLLSFLSFSLQVTLLLDYAASQGSLKDLLSDRFTWAEYIFVDIGLFGGFGFVIFPRVMTGLKAE
jgi:hypothetical protein